MLPLIAIVGPTSSGKTSFSISLAKSLKKSSIVAEIVSADSRQVYRGLNLLSGKATKKEMSGIRHHLLDIANPKRVYSVAQFKIDAEKAIAGIHKRGHLPILVGGTGFYVDAITKGIVLPQVEANTKLRKVLEKKTLPELLSMLEKLDSFRTKTVDTKNKVRLIRAIEIATTLGKVPKVEIKPMYKVLTIGIDLPDDVLKKNIHTRLLSRMKAGMLREAKKLHNSGVSWKRMEELGLECRYCALYLQNNQPAGGKMTTLLSELELAIWHYAKRQRTWFKRDKEILWID